MKMYSSTLPQACGESSLHAFLRPLSLRPCLQLALQAKVDLVRLQQKGWISKEHNVPLGSACNPLPACRPGTVGSPLSACLLAAAANRPPLPALAGEPARSHRGPLRLTTSTEAVSTGSGWNQNWGMTQGDTSDPRGFWWMEKRKAQSQSPISLPAAVRPTHCTCGLKTQTTHFYARWNSTVLFEMMLLHLHHQRCILFYFFFACSFPCCVAWLQYALAFKSTANPHGRIHFNDSFDLQFYLKKKKEEEKNVRSAKNWAQIGHQGRNLTSNRFFSPFLRANSAWKTWNWRSVEWKRWTVCRTASKVGSVFETRCIGLLAAHVSFG